MKPAKAIELDGRTGEGGGQLVRIALALAAVTSQPVRIVHVRGNREGPKGGGLKAQHVSAAQWLVKATGAEVTGLSIGSHTLEFRPTLSPRDLQTRKIEIEADSAAASTTLIFQAVLPFLLFAGNEDGGSIKLIIRGGTNVSFSPAYEYLSQVLIPALRSCFGVEIEAELKARGWTAGPTGKGCIEFKIHPIRPGETLKSKEPWDRPLKADDFAITRIDATIVAPTSVHASLQERLARDLDTLFPDIELSFITTEESGHDSRVYALLVAHSKTGLRWGRDCLYNVAWRKKRKTPETVGAEVSRKLSKELFEEILVRGVVDEHLQDQLVVFQALAEGRTSFPRGGVNEDSEDGVDEVRTLAQGIAALEMEKRMRRDKAHEPFGEGSLHTTTARWVTAEVLPSVKWFNKGAVCEGAGVKFD